MNCPSCSHQNPDGARFERLDPESVSRLMDCYYQAVRVPVEAHGGTVV
jgi:hypothetical protein